MQNKIECADHYNEVYVKSPSFPRPEMTIRFPQNERLRARPPGYGIINFPYFSG